MSLSSFFVSRNTEFLIFIFCQLNLNLKVCVGDYVAKSKVYLSMDELFNDALLYFMAVLDTIEMKYFAERSSVRRSHNFVSKMIKPIDILSLYTVIRLHRHSRHVQSVFVLLCTLCQRQYNSVVPDGTNHKLIVPLNETTKFTVHSFTGMDLITGMDIYMCLRVVFICFFFRTNLPRMYTGSDKFENHVV